MAFEQFRVQLAMLLDEIAKNPSDAHEMQETLRERLAEMQAMGLPLPEDPRRARGLSRGRPRPPRRPRPQASPRSPTRRRDAAQPRPAAPPR